MGKKIIDYANMPEADILINNIVKRKKQGLYTFTFAAGLPGSGKSSACLRLAELTSLELTGENKITAKNIFDDLLGLIDFVQNADPNEACIGVIEEVSVLFPSRRAMAGDNLAIGKVLDTCRKKQVILFANAPIWNSIDSHLRAMGHIYLEALSMNKREGVVISKAFRLQTNPGSGKTYFHRFHRNGAEVHRIITRKPNAKTWNDYELNKDKSMRDLYDQLKFKALQKQNKLMKEMGKDQIGTIINTNSPTLISYFPLKTLSWILLIQQE